MWVMGMWEGMGCKHMNALLNPSKMNNSHFSRDRKRVGIMVVDEDKLLVDTQITGGFANEGCVRVRERWLSIPVLGV